MEKLKNLEKRVRSPAVIDGKGMERPFSPRMTKGTMVRDMKIGTATLKAKGLLDERNDIFGDMDESVGSQPRLDESVGSQPRLSTGRPHWRAGILNIASPPVV